MHDTFIIKSMMLAVLSSLLCACTVAHDNSNKPLPALLHNFITLCSTAHIDVIVAHSLSTTYLCPSVSDDEARLWRGIIRCHQNIEHIVNTTTNDNTFHTNWQMQRRAGVLFLVKGDRTNACRALYTAWTINTNDIESLFVSALSSIHALQSNLYLSAISNLHNYKEAYDHVCLLRATYANSIGDYDTALEYCSRINTTSTLSRARHYCEMEAHYFRRSTAGDLKKAVAHMLSHDCIGADIYEKTAYAALRAKDTTAAFIAAMGAIQNGSTNATMYSLAAALCKDRGEHMQETALRRQIAHMQPSDISNRVLLVRLYAQHKLYGAARMAAWQVYILNTNEGAKIIQELLL